MQRPDTFQQVDAISGADAIAHVSLADVLNRRADPVRLFTPAVLITHGRFDRDPVVEFDARFPVAEKHMRPFYTALASDKPSFFSGLGCAAVGDNPQVVNWDRRLYCIDERRADECFGFLSGIAFSDPKAGFFGSVFSHALDVPDPTSRRGQMLSVMCFGVVTSTFVSFLAPRSPGAIPRVVTVPVNDADAAAEFLRNCNVLSSFDGTDLLNLRD
jgi:hypothetical protein